MNPACPDGLFEQIVLARNRIVGKVLEMTDNHDRAIDRIEGKLGLLLKRQERREDRRGDIYKQLESLRKNQDTMTRDIKNINIRLDAVEQPVAEFNRWRERMIGASMLISLLVALAGSTVAAYWTKVVTIFR